MELNTRHYGVVSRGPRGPVDLGFGPTVAERRPNPPLICYALAYLLFSDKITSSATKYGRMVALQSGSTSPVYIDGKKIYIKQKSNCPSPVN